MAVRNRGPQYEAVCCTLIATAIVSTLLRCYVRARLVKHFGVDDWFMVAAVAIFTLFITCSLLGIRYGTGRHHEDLKEADLEKALKWWWYCYLWYCLTMILTKMSIGCFLLRITIRRTEVWIIWGVMIATVLTGIVFFFVTLFQCEPVSYFWNQDQPGTCLSIKAIIVLTYLYSVISVICDFTFAILPMVIVWKLKMERRNKIALIPILAMACIASTAVVVRFAYVDDFNDPDFLYSTLDIAIWSATEQGLAITAGSLATLRPLFRLVLRGLGSWTRAQSVSEGENKQGESRFEGSQSIGLCSHRNREQFNVTTLIEKGDATEHAVGGEADAPVERPEGGNSKGRSPLRRAQRGESTPEASHGGPSDQDHIPLRVWKVTTITMEEDRAENLES